jgi:hypothetical protein
LVDGLRELVEIALVCPVVSSLLPSQKIAQSGVIANYVKVAETACSTPDTSKQAQYKLHRLVTPVGALRWNTAFLKLLFEMASLKHLQKQ